MCGRITQHRPHSVYLDAIGWESVASLVPEADQRSLFNVAPGSYPAVMHTLDAGVPALDTLHWGYQPSWAASKKIPMSINARLETAATKPYFRSMFNSRRIIVPADGWYEWTGEKGVKQPWYIRLRTDQPMFLAAICNLRSEPSDEGKRSGFVIVTAAADGGMVDVHDRRPVVFTAEDARIWMDNDAPPEQAESLARNRSLPVDDFEWYAVSTAVNNVRNNADVLIQPVAAQPTTVA